MFYAWKWLSCIDYLNKDSETFMIAKKTPMAIGFQIYCDQLIHFFFYLRYEVQLWEYKVQCFKQQVEFAELRTWE